MNNIKITDLARASGSRLFGDAQAEVNNIVIDSRQCFPGCMFVCVIGENNDGHKFADAAYDKGCRVFLMSDVNAAEQMMKSHEDSSIILCSDTEEAFRQMASWYINMLGVKKIGITGSVGKTTTKALTAQILSQKYNVVCSQKNYNTQLGLCMTSFLADEETDIIVYEMGMDKSGEIDSYCSWVRPNTAIITIIGDSHLEKLGSKENIAKAKFEITNYLEDDDVLIFNSDSPFMDMYTLSRMTKGNYIPVPVGSREDASVRILNVKDLGTKGISFDLQLKNESLHVGLPLLGKHNACNAALAACCGLMYGVEPDQIIDALSKATATDRRLVLEDINGIKLLDDSYNANPASMSAAIDVLMSIEATRHIAILADMYELGEDEISGHVMTGEKVGRSNVDLFIAIGKNAELMVQAAKTKSRSINTVSFADAESAMEKIAAYLKNGDAVLIKGSNATKVSAIAEMLRGLKN